MRERESSDICAPSLEELNNRMADYADAHPTLARLTVVGESVRGRPIHLVSITDQLVPDNDKQVVLLAGTLHGNEWLGPPVMLKLMEWLTTPEAEETLKNQRILLFPCVNVDGYAARTFTNASGVDLKSDFKTLSQPESRAVWEVVAQNQPEIVIDYHGNTGDLNYWCPQNLAARPANGLEWDIDLLAKMAAIMDEKSTQAGYPPNMGGGVAEVFPLPQRAYETYHSLGLVMHGMPRPEADLWDVRFQTLLEIGNQRWPTEHRAGYPTSVVMHDPWSNTFLTTCGATAQARRESRVALWQAREHIELLEGNPDRRGMILAFARSSEHPTTMNIPHGAGLRFRMPAHSRVDGLQINGSAVTPAEDAIWQGGHHTWLQTYISNHPVERHPDCRFAAASAVLRYQQE